MALEAQLGQELKLAPSIDGQHFSEEVAVQLAASCQNQPSVQQVVPGRLEEVWRVSKHPHLSETLEKNKSVHLTQTLYNFVSVRLNEIT